VRSRYSGQNAFIEISLGFDPDMRLREVDEIISRMKEELEREIPHSEVVVIPRVNQNDS
jgi:divalent metal cation (Fe/Co/Zn/Cd) transporter